MRFEIAGARFAPALGLQPLDVGDRLLEQVAKNRDRHLAPVVPLPKLRNIRRQFLRQYKRIGYRVFGEQAAVVGIDVEIFVAAIHGPEKGQEVLPNRLRQRTCFSLRRPAEEARPAGRIGSLGEGDEENAVEDFLRTFDGLEHRSFGPSPELVRKSISRSRRPLYWLYSSSVMSL